MLVDELSESDLLLVAGGEEKKESPPPAKKEGGGKEASKPKSDPGEKRPSDPGYTLTAGVKGEIKSQKGQNSWQVMGTVGFKW
jgi:hypothetical protein